MKREAMKKAKAIINEIESRVNRYTEERDINAYHVKCEITHQDKTGASIEVTPVSENVFYCIEDLVLVATFFKAYFYVLVDEGKPVFRMYGIK